MHEVPEKRRIQRIRLDQPVSGTVAGVGVKIVDLSTVGVRVEHDFPLTAGRNVRLEFLARGERLQLTCEVVRSRLQRSVTGESGTIVYNSGLRFVDPHESARAQVRELVASLVLARIEEGRRARASAK